MRCDSRCIAAFFLASFSFCFVFVFSARAFSAFQSLSSCSSVVLRPSGCSPLATASALAALAVSASTPPPPADAVEPRPRGVSDSRRMSRRMSRITRVTLKLGAPWTAFFPMANE